MLYRLCVTLLSRTRSKMKHETRTPSRHMLMSRKAGSICGATSSGLHEALHWPQNMKDWCSAGSLKLFSCDFLHVVCIVVESSLYNLPWRLRGEYRYSSILSLTSATDGGCFLKPLHPGKDTRYPFYSKLGGRQGRSGRVRKISPPPPHTPGFDLRAVQPVASRYAIYAIPAHFFE